MVMANKNLNDMASRAQKGGVRKNSFFSDADPNAPIRSSIARFRDGSDPAKRGGRFKSDFIWNTNWQEQMKFNEDEDRRRKDAEAQPAEPQRGFLNFNRLDEDLSEALQPRASSSSVASAAPATVAGVQVKPRAKNDSIKSSHGEMRRWQRQDKFNRTAAPKADAPPAVTQEMRNISLAKAQAAGYDSMQSEVQVWSLALCGMCSAATAFFYSQDIAVSYAAGAVGGLFYLRLLQKSMEGIMGSGNMLSSGLSNQRLLVPVILVMAFNRWNVLAAERTGIELELLPMLLGFFTYKAALVARQSVALFEEMSGKRPLAQQATAAASEVAAEPTNTSTVNEQPDAVRSTPSAAA
ncbi:hypothetical protein WJX73_001780 [Symbiochloris irregularis]|uniref:CGL160/ATPI domain-containing protein n=1 Tax=Symbiochloris irregularis TaxID=706552 RepID=A0AAW1NM70_9CHLO